MTCGLLIHLSNRPCQPSFTSVTTYQTHKKLAQNKNSCCFFIGRFYVVHLCFPKKKWCISVLFLSIQSTKIAKYFHIPYTKNSISILFYFINTSYSSLAFDQFQQTWSKNNVKDWTLNPLKKISNKREKKIILKIEL